MKSRTITKTTETITTTRNGKTQTQHIEIYKDSRCHANNNVLAQCKLIRLSHKTPNNRNIFPTKMNPFVILLILIGSYVYLYFIKISILQLFTVDVLSANILSYILYAIFIALLSINIVTNIKINKNPVLLKMKRISEDENLKLPQMYISYWVNDNKQASKKEEPIEWICPYIKRYRMEFKTLMDQIEMFEDKHKFYRNEIKSLYKELSKPCFAKKQKYFKSMIVQMPSETTVIKISLKYHTPGGKYREYVYNFNILQAKQIFNEIIKTENNIKIKQNALNNYNNTNKSTEAFNKLCIDCKIDPTKALLPNDILNSRAPNDLTGVYILHNITNGMCYVGQATKINRRLKQHFSGYGCIDAYDDWLSGNVFIIERFPLVGSSFNTLDEQERYYIEKYDSYRNGYNKTQGNN